MWAQLKLIEDSQIETYEEEEVARLQYEQDSHRKQSTLHEMNLKLTFKRLVMYSNKLKRLETEFFVFLKFKAIQACLHMDGSGKYAYEVLDRLKEANIKNAQDLRANFNNYVTESPDLTLQSATNDWLLEGDPGGIARDHDFVTSTLSVVGGQIQTMTHEANDDIRAELFKSMHKLGEVYSSRAETLQRALQTDHNGWAAHTGIAGMPLKCRKVVYRAALQNSIDHQLLLYSRDEMIEKIQGFDASVVDEIASKWVDTRLGNAWTILSKEAPQTPIKPAFVDVFLDLFCMYRLKTIATNNASCG